LAHALRAIPADQVRARRGHFQGFFMHRLFLLPGAACALLSAVPALAQDQVESITVTAQRLGEARAAIQTQLGASTYSVTAADIQAFPGGVNLQFNNVILQTPGVAQDSFGQLHVRGEHAGLQYRLNGVILPEGISVFGQTLDPRLAESVQLIDGALPAEYGNQTGGIVDIQTKTGFFAGGGQIGTYGGSHKTFTPSFDYGGSVGSFNYFVSGSYTQNGLGIESPDGSPNPLHDDTTQWHGFAFLQDILDQNSSLTAVLGSSNDIFQIPNTPGLQPSGLDGIVGLGPLSPDSGDYLLKAGGQTGFPSENLDERQREITHYAILSYLRSDGALDSQVSVFGRYSSLFFTPGANVGDILFNGIAQTAYKRDEAFGVQAEGAWHGLPGHTVRFGLIYQADDLISRTTSLVLPADSGGPLSPNPNPLCKDTAQTCQTGDQPRTILDNGMQHAWLFGVYAQDEWKIFDSLTLNFGLRYDEYSAFDKENQVSPRANLVWKPTGTTTVHLGYSRYFSPPPYENVASTDIALFDNTTVAADHTDTTPKAERADYYDAGMQQKITDEITLGLDSYFKADHDLLDEGQFGAPIILTPFNYQGGRQYGAEFTANYNRESFNAYFNAAYERAAGKAIVSSEFEFDPGDLAYIADHYIPLDHQQIVSLSGGLSYRWQDTTVSTDFLYGSGLRRDGATPNGDSVPAYITANLGVSHTVPGRLTARFDVINLFDEVYEIRDGTGVGVGAPQFGARRGFFFGLSREL
jgi:outer membrane receptor protein involved in Fe transport